VWFVDLAPVADPKALGETVAVALGVREEPGRTLVDTLVAHLEPRRALIVLDNCEHLLAACATLARRLLDAVPDLTLIATSREPLGLDDEHVHAVPTLALPGDAEAADPGALARNESARLFLERAERARAGFALAPDETRDLVEICRALDGIPLAIELAAARVRVLSLREIRAKLADRFRLLTGGGRGAAPRQQTLRAALQWSWDQLAEPERALLRALSVFTGGWSLGTATAIGLGDGDEFEVLDLLTRLVDKSLIVTPAIGRDGARYRLLETVREYAREQLEAAGEAATMRNRHLAYFLALGEKAEQELVGSRQEHWFATLETEHQNLLAAFAWSAHTPEGPDTGLRLATSIYRFWSARGHYEIGRRTLAEALARPDARPPGPARAHALVRAAGMAMYQSDTLAAEPLLEEALTISRSLGDSRGIARAVSGLGTVAIYRNDVATARARIEEGLALYRAVNSPRGVAVSLHSLAIVETMSGDLDAAERCYVEALGIFKQVGDEEYIASASVDHALVLVRRGRLAEARAKLATAVEIAARLGAGREAVNALDAIAELALAGADVGAARGFMHAADAIRASIGLPVTSFERAQRGTLEDRIRATGAGPPAPTSTPSPSGDLLALGLAAARTWLESANPGQSPGPGPQPPQ
jgi:non-specific serine/threonine protein kinase